MRDVTFHALINLDSFFWCLHSNTWSIWLASPESRVTPVSRTLEQSVLVRAPTRQGIPLADGSNMSYRRCSASCYQPIYHSKPTGFTHSLYWAPATIPRRYINGVLEVTLIELKVSSLIIARRWRLLDDYVTLFSYSLINIFMITTSRESETVLKAQLCANLIVAWQNPDGNLNWSNRSIDNPLFNLSSLLKLHWHKISKLNLNPNLLGLESDLKR